MFSSVKGLFYPVFSYTISSKKSLPVQICHLIYQHYMFPIRRVVELEMHFNDINHKPFVNMGLVYIMLRCLV